MSEYIKREDAIQVLGEYLMADAMTEYLGTASEDIEDWKDLAKIIFKDLSHIDIVRCKECKWHGAKMIPKSVRCIAWHKADDYCSYGERKGE